MAIDGFEWDAPDTPENAAESGSAGKAAGAPDRPAFPKVRVVTVSECGSHAVVDAEIGGVAGKGAGEQALARKLYRRLDPEWLVIADRNFYNWEDWRAAADSGAELLWRGQSHPPPPPRPGAPGRGGPSGRSRPPNPPQARGPRGAGGPGGRGPRPRPAR